VEITGSPKSTSKFYKKMLKKVQNFEIILEILLFSSKIFAFFTKILAKIALKGGGMRAPNRNFHGGGVALKPPPPFAHVWVQLWYTKI
jgi:hypothetical protein